MGLLSRRGLAPILEVALTINDKIRYSRALESFLKDFHMAYVARKYTRHVASVLADWLHVAGRKNWFAQRLIILLLSLPRIYHRKAGSQTNNRHAETYEVLYET